MIYLVAIFIPPLYFLLRGKWLGFIVNSIFYGIALLCAVSIVGLVIAPFPWFVASVHAVWHIRKELVIENAEIMATKMAAAFREQNVSPPAPRD